MLHDLFSAYNTHNFTGLVTSVPAWRNAVGKWEDEVTAGLICIQSCILNVDATTLCNHIAQLEVSITRVVLKNEISKSDCQASKISDAGYLGVAKVAGFLGPSSKILSTISTQL